MRALYVGIQTPGTTSQLRAQTLLQVLPSASWTQIDTDLIFRRSSRLARSMWFRLKAGPAVTAVNRLVLQQLEMQTYDVAWIDKGVCLWPSTVRAIRERSSKMIYYTPDTSFLANRSRHFVATVSMYDLVVTTKSAEMADFQRRIPTNRLLLVTQSFDSRLHYPRCSFEQKRNEAVLVGLCEPDRERCVEQLLSAGVAVRVAGRGWARFLRRHAGHSLLYFEGEAVFGDHYAETLSRAKVGLGLITKRFSELHTTRTFEIPACGTALATERNAETETVFRESEALFFDSYADLASKVAQVLREPALLQAITKAGNQRVHSGPYSNERVIRQVLERAGLEVP